MNIDGRGDIGAQRAQEANLAEFRQNPEFMASHAGGGLGSSIRERAGSLRGSLRNDNAN